MPSKEPTPWAVICLEHGTVYLTREEYNTQLSSVNLLWFCPWCNRAGIWDDDTYEQALDEIDRFRDEDECVDEPEHYYSEEYDDYI